MPTGTVAISYTLDKRAIAFWVALVAVVACIAVVCFAPGRTAPFDFDDIEAIAENSTIRSAWPPTALAQWPKHGAATSGRPLSNYSFAIDFALTRRVLGVDEAGPASPTLMFHVTNIILHIVTALLLGLATVVTLTHSRFAPRRNSARLAAGAAALLWLVHPLNAEAVNYLSQRTELLASLWIAGALLSAIRAAYAPTVVRRRAWTAAVIAAAWMGVASKEVAVVIPLLVIAYDLAFIYEAPREIFRNASRRVLYAGLISSWLLAGVLIAVGGRGGTVGLRGGTSPLQYLVTQGWATTHYLQLFLLPVGLTFDYGAQAIGWSALPYGVVGLALVALVILLWRSPRTRGIAFLGTWWFVCLAPSSSIIPIQTEIAAERRAYLASYALACLASLALVYVADASSERRTARGLSTRRFIQIAVVALVVALLAGVQSRPGAGSALHITPMPHRAALTLVLALVVIACSLPSRVVRACCVLAVIGMLAFTTRSRTLLYRDPIERWSVAREETPDNPRVYQNLVGAILRTQPERIDEASALSAQASQAFPNFLPLQIQGADIAMATGKVGRADSLIDNVLRISPTNAMAVERKGRLLLSARRPTEALPYLTASAAAQPSADLLSLKGLAFLMIRQNDSAVAAFTQALGANPSRLDIERYLGAALIDQRKGAEASVHLRRAALGPGGESLDGLRALGFAIAGQKDSAALLAQRVAENPASDHESLIVTGRAYMELRRYDDAAEVFQRAVQLDPKDVRGLNYLAQSAEALGFFENAARFYEAARRLSPRDTTAIAGLGRVTRR